MVRANYSYKLIGNQLFIIDNNLGGMSVTNCIEDIIPEIAKREQRKATDFLVVYQDSMGIWDGWDHESQSFITLNESVGIDAMNKLILKLKEEE